MSRLLISGFYGFDNAGDEAVLASMGQLFRERRPDLQLTVLSGAPAATRRLHGVEAVPRMARRAVTGAVAACDLFVSGGGSLLQDTTSARSAIYYLAVIYLALRARKPVALYCQGIGPLRRPALRRLTRLVLNRTSLITVRDEESARELQRLGVGQPGPFGMLHHGDTEDTERGAKGGQVAEPPARTGLPSSPPGRASSRLPSLYVAADPVFALLPDDRFEAEKWLPRAPEGGWLGVSVRPWAGMEALLPRLAEALEAIRRQSGLTPLLLPLQWDADRPVCARLAASVPGAATLKGPGLDPRGWIALVGELRALVAMRLHALIFAASRGTPLAGISYDPKVTALLERLGDRPAATVEAFDPARLAEAVHTALSDTTAADHRQQAAARMAAAAGQATDLTLGLLGR